MLTIYHHEEELIGTKGLFIQLKNDGCKNMDKPLMLIFHSNTDVDRINTNTINKDFDIVKINTNPDILPLSRNLYEAKCIIWHKYLEQLDLTDLKSAVQMFNHYHKPVVYFVNTYSFQGISEEVENYINDNFQKAEYTPQL